MKNAMLGAALAFGVLFQAAPQAALVAPPGLGAGDSYRLVFLTEGVTNATSSLFSAYDNLVQAEADAAGVGASEGLAWQAIVSTAGINARDHTATDPSDAGVPIFRVDGVRIATGYADFWGSHEDAINVEADGTSIASLPGDHFVWTGTRASGLLSNGGELGNARPVFGNAQSATALWVETNLTSQSNSFRLYGISDPLTVVPLPAGAWLLLSAIVGVGATSRLSSKRPRHSQ